MHDYYVNSFDSYFLFRFGITSIFDHNPIKAAASMLLNCSTLAFSLCLLKNRRVYKTKICTTIKKHILFQMSDDTKSESKMKVTLIILSS